MKYFIPQIEPPADFGFQSIVKEKLGGLPFGLPSEMYPVCKNCGSPMSLLAQFVHDDERLNLGKGGRNLFVFQCNNVDSGFPTCLPSGADSGANTCFVAESENLTNQVENSPHSNVELEKEYWITNWQEMDDGLSEEESLVFFNEDKYYELDDETFEQLLEKVEEKTRLGGVPSWIQQPEIPQGNWKFVGQLDSDTGFNFGDAGIGYIFIEEVDNSSQLPRGKFLWQCS